MMLRIHYHAENGGRSLAFVFVFWYWVGRELEFRMCPERILKRKWPTWVAVVLQTCGLLICMGGGVLTAVLFATEDRPMPSDVKQILASAMVWVLVLGVYFAFQLRSSYRTHRQVRTAV